MAVDLISDMRVPGLLTNDYRETLHIWLHQQVDKLTSTGRKGKVAIAAQIIMRLWILFPY